MKPKPILRIIFALLVVAGSIFFLYGARTISVENNYNSNNICETEPERPFQQSNTEFIFFESVTKFLVVSLLK